ncbi:MAG TPA: ATP-binding protein [Anaerolineales bacterium]|nr:ATP-binding protein [Anaerolineales bacterium]
MRLIRTVRARFALSLTVLILGFLVIFGGGIYFAFSRSLYGAVEDTLSLSATQVLAGLSEDDAGFQTLAPDPGSPHMAEFGAFLQRGLTLIVLSSNGEVLEAVGPYHDKPMPVSPSLRQPSFQTIAETEDSDPILVYILPVMQDGRLLGWVQTMKSLGGEEESLDRLRTVLLIGTGLLSLLAGFAGYFLVARALAPIDEITETAHRISTEDLSARLNLPDTGDEVSRLANTFDEMLRRIEGGFARERQFTSDASHELRTPLTAMRTILNFIREGERPAQDYRQALDDLAEETDRLQALVENLLQLARGERGLKLQAEEIDLTILLTDIADSLRPLAESRQLTLTCDLPPCLVISGDPDQLIRLVVNLLDNAIKYTEQGTIRLSAWEAEGYALIEVLDTGIGIPAEHLPHIFERFYRVDLAHSSGGAGLGLSIARQIVQAHRGRIEVQSETGDGTRFRVYLPK